MTNDNIHTDASDREIFLTREFDAPREVVFNAFTAPEKIGQWWGPNGFTTTTESMNFEVGGEWVFTMHGPDGTDYPNRIVYTKIKRPEHIKYDHFGHMDDASAPPHFKATVIFEDQETKTKLTMRMLFPTAEAKVEAVKYGAVEGGKQTLNRLEKYLELK